MPFTTAAIDALLDLLFNNSNWANIGDGTGLRGSTTAGVFWLSLHSASPGAGGNQGTNEVSYGGYTRISVARTAGGWVRTGDTINPAAQITFPVATSGTVTVTHGGIGTDSSGAGHLIYYGTITPNISVATGIEPKLTVASAITET